LATKQVDGVVAGVLTPSPSETIAAQPASVMEAEVQAALQAAQAAQNPQAMAGARKSAPPAPAGDAVEATKPTESLALLSNALNKIEAAAEMKLVVAAETAEAGLRLASLEAPKAVGSKPSGELRAEGISMQPPGFMGPDGMLQRADAPPPSSPMREASAPLPARQLAPVVVSLVLGRGDEALTIALDPVELGRVEVSIGQGKEAGQIRIVAERPETLALLQRDQRELDRSLNQAGLSDMGRSLSFSLASDQGRQHQQQHAAHHGANRFAGALTGIEPERPLGPIPMPARAGSNSLLDIAV
jgi:Meckel syndrome type 1 protein